MKYKPNMILAKKQKGSSYIHYITLLKKCLCPWDKESGIMGWSYLNPNHPEGKDWCITEQLRYYKTTRS